MSKDEPGQVAAAYARGGSEVARADDELGWLAEARARTVREMRRLAKQHVQRSSARSNHEAETERDDESDGELPTSVEEELKTLAVTVDREDAWLFECARRVVQQVGGMTEGETIEALLGEGTAGVRRRASVLTRYAPFGSGDAALSVGRGDAALLPLARAALSTARAAGHELSRVSLRRIDRCLEARAGLDGGVRECLWSRSLPLHESCVRTARGDTASPEISLGGGRRLGRERG